MSSIFMGKRKLCLFMDFSLFIFQFIYWKKKNQTNKKTIISHILYFANCMYSEHISWKLELPRGLHRSRFYFTERTSQCCLLCPLQATPATHTHENTQDSYGLFSEMSRWIRRTTHIEKSRITVWIYPSIYYQNN